jgi:uncharacterized repeat protein (TIGR04052 family)
MPVRYVMLIALTASLAGCGKESTRVEIPFLANFANAPISCDGSTSPALTDLRFYVHDVRLIDLNEQAHVVQLDETPWQQRNLAFLDLEDGTANCSNGTSDTRRMLQGTVERAEFRGLEFTLGVPFSQNHGDPLQAQLPLGDADMHWHWRGGYKFLRAGLRTEDDGFWIHLGSTACEGTIRNITGCNAPNRVTVRLDNYTPGDVVAVDLAGFVERGALDDATPSDCSSGPAEEPCVDAFAVLGLNHATGDDEGRQRVFSSRGAP